MSSIVENIVKDDYMNWKQGDTIIINTFTGSGKTYFVFNRLLELAIKSGKKIIYFCNRRSIKNQLLSSYKDKSVCVNGQEVSIWHYLHVFTYQYCEKSKQFDKFEKLCIDNMISEEEEFFDKYGKYMSIDMDDVLYYVYDEAHYFVSDASFNSDTSFWDIQELTPKDKISIFLTATPEPLYCFLYLKQHKETIENFLKNFYLNKESERSISEEITYVKRAISEIDELKARGPITDVCKENYDKLNQELIDLNGKLFKEKAYRKVVYFVEGMIEYFGQYKRLPEKFHIYTQNKNFDNYDCFYFQEFDDIMELVIKSDKKTLIFVDSEADGKNIEKSINGNDVKAVFISAGLLNNKDLPANSEYENLIQNEMFACKVLIATSVIDCGVNISDNNLGNIVLSQPNKTAFFQMLGRCRINDKTKINLYIKNTKPTTISAFSSQAIQKLNLALRFLNYKNGLVRDSVYGDSERNALLAEISSQGLSKVIVLSDYHSSNAQKDSFNVDLFKIYKINYPNLLYYFYSLYLYYGTLLENKENDNTSEFYLINQLNWLGKKYDISKWVGYMMRHKDLELFLQGYMKSDGIHKEEKTDFREKIFRKILAFPTALLPSDMQKNISKYKSGKISLPQKNKLNEALKKLNVPYSIEKKSSYSEKWVIKKRDDS